MPLVKLFGHAALRARLLAAIGRGELPHSILLQGTRGIGKQRLALWLAQTLLCERNEPGDEGCGTCNACRAALRLQHPDLYWLYPRPRLKDADATTSDVLEDYAESNAERLETNGLYAPPSGSEGLYVATTRAIVAKAALAPAMGRRKVFIIGDAERMVSQEGADQAANAFLKLLEEPPADTTIILTSSEPGALLPTIRSRVVSYRCVPLANPDVEAFLKDPIVAESLSSMKVPGSAAERVANAAGAPGTLLGGEARAAALSAASDIVAAAMEPGPRGAARRYATALAQGAASARGAYSDTLEALTVVLRDRARDAVARDDTLRAYTATRAIDSVARAQACADGNVNPQLVTARLLRELSELL